MPPEFRCNGVCSWPHELDPDCPLHGRVIGCECGISHDTIPLMTIGIDFGIEGGEPPYEELFLMGVCRKHRRHVPCAGCDSESHRLAEAELFGRPFRPPKDLHLGNQAAL